MEHRLMRHDLALFFVCIFLLCFFFGRLFKLKDSFPAEKYGFGINWVYLIIAAAAMAVYSIVKK